MATFYILYSSAIDKYYAGHTSIGVEERLQKHLTHHGGFTSKTTDRIVVYSEVYATKEEAYSRERQVKGWKSRRLIERLINKA